MLGLALAALPLYVLYAFRTELLSRALRSLMMALLTLLPLGFFLWLVMRYNLLWLNILSALLLAAGGGLLTVMLSRLSLRRYALPSMAGTLVAVFVVSLYFLLGISDWKQAGEAHRLLPLVGLLAGAIASTNSKALSTFYTALEHHAQQYEYLLGNGGTHGQATEWFMRRALQRMALPYLRRLATAIIGTSPLVFFTMLLCGQNVGAALEWQLLLMLAAFTAATLSLIATIFFARKFAFDDYGKMKKTTAAAPLPDADEISSDEE